MTFPKSYLVTGVIAKIIKTALKIVYTFLKALKLRLVALLVILGLILYLLGTFDSNGTIKILYVIALVGAVIASLWANLTRFSKKDKKDKKAVQIVSEKDTDNNEQEIFTESEPAKPQTVYPKYYNVKQNPAYVMAEYEDKFVLYLKSSSGLIKIRTDYKENL